MKAPRDLSGAGLAKALKTLGYEITRQTGSHMRVTRHAPKEHHVTIPAHNPMKIGTLNAILRDIAVHHGMEKSELIVLLFG